MVKSNVNVFYRCVKAQKGHPFPGLYAVEKVFFRDGKLVKQEIVHEWDLRIIAEAKLAQLGGSSAYETYKLDNEIEEVETPEASVEAVARTPEEVKLTARKLAKELKGPTA